MPKGSKTKQIEVVMINGNPARKCRNCGETKLLSEFVRDKRNYVGVGARCRKCVYTENNAHYATKGRNLQLRINYGITLEDYNNIYKGQNGKCLICKEFNEKLFVDHCHITERVRGLLCQKCNAGLGMFNDNATIVDNAHRYLNEFQHD